MDRRFTAALVLVFVALVAFAWWFAQDAGEPVDVGAGTATPTPEPLLELEASNVQDVGVVGASGSYTLTRVAGGWEVDGEEASEAVDSVVDELASPSVVGEIPSDRNPEDYGFATPALTVTLLTAAGDETVFEVGDQVLMGSEYYVRLAGEDRIVWISGYNIDQLKDWLDEPPLAPTATPEVTETPEGEEATDAEGEATDDTEAELGAAAGEAEAEQEAADEEVEGEDQPAADESDSDTGGSDSASSDEAEGAGSEEEAGSEDAGEDEGESEGGEEALEPTEVDAAEP